MCMTDVGCMSIQPGQLDAACPEMYSMTPSCSQPCYAVLASVSTMLYFVCWRRQRAGIGILQSLLLTGVGGAAVSDPNHFTCLGRLGPAAGKNCWAQRRHGTTAS